MGIRNQATSQFSSSSHCSDSICSVPTLGRLDPQSNLGPHNATLKSIEKQSRKRVIKQPIKNLIGHDSYLSSPQPNKNISIANNQSHLGDAFKSVTHGINTFSPANNIKPKSISVATTSPLPMNNTELLEKINSLPKEVRSHPAQLARAISTQLTESLGTTATKAVLGHLKYGQVLNIFVDALTMNGVTHDLAEKSIAKLLDTDLPKSTRPSTWLTPNNPTREYNNTARLLNLVATDLPSFTLGLNQTAAYWDSQVFKIFSRNDIGLEQLTDISSTQLKEDFIERLRTEGNMGEAHSNNAANKFVAATERIAGRLFLQSTEAHINPQTILTQVENFLDHGGSYSSEERKTMDENLNNNLIARGLEGRINKKLFANKVYQVMSFISTAPIATVTNFLSATPVLKWIVGETIGAVPAVLDYAAQTLVSDQN